MVGTQQKISNPGFPVEVFLVGSRRYLVRQVQDVTTCEEFNPPTRDKSPSVFGANEAIVILTDAERLSSRVLRSCNHKDCENRCAFGLIRSLTNETHVAADVTDD